MSDVRERRRQHHQETKRKEVPTDLARKAILPAIIILIVAGIGAGMYFTAKSAGECPGHWHATYNVYVDDDRMSYQHRQYNLGAGGATPMSYHLHQPNDYMIHFEPPTGGCIEFRTFLAVVDTKLTSTTLTLDGAHADLNQAGVYEPEDGSNRTLHLYHAPNGDDWKEISASALNKRQLLDGERVLIAFGNYSEARIEQMQAAVPYPSGSTPAAHPGA